MFTRKVESHALRLSSRGPARILVADDDTEMRRLLAVSLRKDGYEVIEASNGMEMLDTLASELLEPVGESPVDLIVSDLRMPGLSGLCVLAGLRGSDWTTPFILITAFGGPEILNQALLEGATAVFDKPFDVDDLRAFVRELTGGVEVENGESAGELGGEG